MNNDEPAVDERVTYTVAEVAQALGIGERQAYQAVHAGTIPSIRIGTRTLIPRRALQRLLDAGDEHEPLRGARR